ncbi:TPA: HP1 family phage holin, partial [Pseudomonas aeruginosa]
PVRSMTDDRVMSAASYTGAGISVLSGLTLTDVGIIVGIATAILTFIANIVWQVRKDRREKELYELERQALHEKLGR